MLLLLAALTAAAQTPADAWRTVRTEHYRVHYPVEAEAFALDMAPQLESIRARVEAEVGWEMDRVVDVVVEDPYAVANGMALPVRGRPRMVVWTTPPGATSVIGNYRSWVEDLVVHEDTHLVHLLRPSRNRVARLLTDQVLGVGPMVLKSPMWLVEGYATHLEGSLTGHGRPHADFRAALLRRWALEGRLPAYDDLDGSGRWLGRAVPYLVGSAFVDWLADEHGEQRLRDLWARMSARRIRGFRSAFAGVYGDDPDVVYARFAAWLTHAALEVETARGADETTLWQDLPGTTGAPVLSPDGAQVALVVRDEVGPPSLTVYETADDPELLADWQGRQDRIIARDPGDVAEVRPEAFDREPVATRLRAAVSPEEPRWMPDGAGLLFSGWATRPDGGYGPDLFLWEPGGGERRVTHRADVRSADPHPDGTWAVAVRQRWGRSELVRVDLASGEVATVDGPHTDVVHDHPRIHPAGDRVAYLRHDGAWSVVVRDLATGDERALALPEGGQVASPEWAPDGESLYAVVGLGGFLEIWRLPLDGGPEAVTRTAGAARGPAPTPDGESLFHLVLDSDGFDLHRLDLASAQGAADLGIEARTPAVRRAPLDVPPPSLSAPSDPRSYGLGRPEWRPLVGGSGAHWGGSTELGVRVGDVIGRHEMVALAALGGVEAPVGGSLALTWRRLPVDLRLEGFAFRERGAAHAGGALTARDTHHWTRGQLRGLAGVVHDRDLDAAPWTGGYAGLEAAGWTQASVLWAEVDLEGRTLSGLGSEGAFAILHGRAELDLGLMGSWLALSARWASQPLADGGPALTVGGMEHGVVPEAWLWQRVLTPMAAPEYLATDSRGLQVAWWITPWLSLAWERLTWSEPGGGEAELRWLQLTTELDLEGRPLVRLPGVSIEAGLGVMTVDPEAGDLDKPFADFANYGTWGAVVWRP